jgi:vitamin K-dependent gamma-carboxylase
VTSARKATRSASAPKAPPPLPRAAPPSLLASLFAPVDISFLVIFRVHFAAMMLWTLWDFHAKNQIAELYIDPPFRFSFHGFSWIAPWPGYGMYWHFAVLAVAAVLVLTGFLYRLGALLLCVGFTYVFLLEKAVFLNHYYLMCLFCFLLIFLPAHRAWSVDALLRPRLRSAVVPTWTLWLLRFQVGLPYVYGGIAKLEADWLQGQPMQMWLSISPWHIVLGPVAEETWLALVFSWGGLVFDLAIVPLLLWRRTRAGALAVAVAFHLVNAFTFNIDVFPWLMIGATTVFLPPDWPRRLITEPPGKTPVGGPSHVPVQPPHQPSPRARKASAALLLVYVAVHLVIPLRHWLYPSSVLWTEQGYLFSWHMMMRAKINALRFQVTDRATGLALPTDITRWLTRQQVESMGHDPDMLREFAHFLRGKHEEQGRDVEVRVLALCSLNGRKPQALVDPRVDLSRQPRTVLHQPYIVPLVEPFRRPAWNVPVAEWEKELATPGLRP